MPLAISRAEQRVLAREDPIIMSTWAKCWTEPGARACVKAPGGEGLAEGLAKQRVTESQQHDT